MSLKALKIEHNSVNPVLDELKRRQNPDGGFAIASGQKSRPDATAWALLALRSCGHGEDFLQSAGNHLQSFQLKDGRVLLAHDEPSVVWVTYVAAWAWQGIPNFKEAQEKALGYILKTSGNWSYLQNWVLKHNLRLKGWSWVEGTSSWVDSTALALLALRASGYKNHPRYKEGIKLLENRKLSSGGWNFGNTLVYGTELRPSSESTGMVMALLDREDKRLESSLTLLRSYIRKEAGPLTLAWALIGAGIKNDLVILEQALQLQKEQSFCQTEWLSLLVMAWAVLSSRPEVTVLGFSQEVVK
jgi:hypothetical protein